MCFNTHQKQTNTTNKEMTEKQRTSRQNNSLHLWCEMLAKELNDAGYDINKTLTGKVEIPWTKVTVKEILFKQIMKVMYQKDSTTKLTTKELTQVSETLSRYLAENLGISTEFPSLSSLLTREEA